MFLNDEEIKKEIKIAPFNEAQLGVDAYDLTIDSVFSYDGEHKIKNDEVILKPKQFLLGITREYIELPNNVIALLSSRSSWARKGLSVHASAGIIQAGFKGKKVLELFNMSDKEIKIKAGDAIAQLFFIKGKETKGYSGKYTGQTTPRL